MKSEINIAELLKDCPKGMELDCTIHIRPVIFNCVKIESDYPIRISSKDGFSHSLTYWGSIYNCEDAKCVIFPKGKTTWEGFVPPCKFKDGDIVVGKNCACSYITIFRKIIDDTSFSHHACLTSLGRFKIDDISDNANLRLATEEEKQKLFQVIKENGYKWDPDTKTLEKLNKPRFKVGNKVRHKNNHNVVFTITSIEDDSYGCGVATVFLFDDQDDYELVPDKFDITTLKPFDKILVRDDNNAMWIAALFSHLRETRFYTVSTWYNQCIPFEGNQHLLGTTNDCDEYYKNWE